MEVFVNVRKANNDVFITVCDCDLLGKKIIEGNLVLDISRDFFSGERMTKEAAVDVLRAATIASFVGELAVSCGIEAGLVHRDSIIRIGGIPHAQFIMI
ncbi:MAG: DUF424 family protein [Candidatus Methanomethyliaceae archaeon]|nr:DUF424 family protein [Candidatus Methanomethyliaceae archaeon]MCX8170192.1 DUF424 family protein [Candidatus Methanomethyliaceae archaeon]MDW7971146.1 DUF424 family protein [Nitrososphaerota archaeon]